MLWNLLLIDHNNILDAVSLVVVVKSTMHRRRRGCNWSVCSAARSAASPLDRNHTRRRVPSSAADAAAAAADDDGATKAMDAESVYLQPCWCLWS